MVAPYRALLDRSVAAVDAVHGERVRLEPMVTSQHAPASPDPNRDVIELQAVLRVATEGAADLGFRGVTDFSQMGVGGAAVHISRGAIPDGIVIKKGDILVALDRDGEPRFAVDRQNPRGRGRIVLTLTGLGRDDA